MQKRIEQAQKELHADRFEGEVAVSDEGGGRWCAPQRQSDRTELELPSAGFTAWISAVPAEFCSNTIQSPIRTATDCLADTPTRLQPFSAETRLHPSLR